MIFFTSDLHFGHENVITYENRPFENKKKMDEELIKLWNSVVSIEDEVYVLGDFSLSKKNIVDIGNRLNGVKKIVPGNHDYCFNLKNKSPEKIQSIIDTYRAAGFEIMPEMLSFILPCGAKVLLCHFPYANINQGDTGYEPRYIEKRPKREDDRWLIHGHVHGKWDIRREERCFNVSVEVRNYRPISAYEIGLLIREYYKD